VSTPHDALMRLGIVLEAALRSLSGLHEALHHATAMYALVSPDEFVSAALFYAPIAALLVALALQARVSVCCLSVCLSVLCTRHIRPL
jgi:Gaa1-like, GPI transamidase component